MNIRSLCLGILYFQDATGYEINKLASEGRFSHFIEASYGSIYPTLTKLTEEGLVTWREERQAGKPNRKVYSITDDGKRELINALHQAPRSDIFKSEFLFICLYCDLLDPTYMKQVYQERVRRLEETLNYLNEKKDCCDQPGSVFALGYGVAIHQAALNYLRENESLILNLENKPGVEAAE